MKIIRQKLFATLPAPNIAKKVVGKVGELKPYHSKLKPYKHNPEIDLKLYRFQHLTEREKLADRAADFVRHNSLRKSVYGKNPTRENMDYVMSRIKLPYNAPTKVNPYFNGKLNQLNNFSK